MRGGTGRVAARGLTNPAVRRRLKMVFGAYVAPGATRTRSALFRNSPVGAGLFSRWYTPLQLVWSVCVMAWSL